MQLSQFENAPTKERHPAYEKSMLYTTAPEWSTGEVLLASAYRGLLLDVSESTVDLENIARAPDSMPASTGGRETWTRLLTERGGIASPLRHGQHSPMASRQLMPLVPSIARIAGVLGKRPRSRWNPSNLLLETIGAGLGKTNGEALIHTLGDALEVTTADDVFARFVEESLRQGLQNVQPTPSATAPFRSLALEEDRFRAFRSGTRTRRFCPAERFCKDLPAVIDIKPALTRRQWTVLLEAMLRLGLGMHVLWTCSANNTAWEIALAVASGDTPPTAAEVENSIWETHDETRPLLELGANAEPLMERMIERYANARTGLNLLLCRLEEAGVEWPMGTAIGSSTHPSQDAPAALAAFFAHVHSHRQRIDANDAGKWLRARVAQLFDSRDDLRDLAQCDSGYTKNLFEFTRHSLGQNQGKGPRPALL